MAAHARDALPAECCGVLLGNATDILEAVRTGNIADEPTRGFIIDPKDHIDARREARGRGLGVVGFYHSHPRSEPEPSPTDIEAAAYHDHWYLILRPLPVGYRARLFRLEGSHFVEVAIT